MDTEDFICSYMKSSTRKYVDEAQAYVCTMDAKTLWEYFLHTDRYELKKGTSLGGFMLAYLKKAYAGLHDLELELAVRKVGIA